MSRAIAAQPVAVVRFGRSCEASLARAALRNRWELVEGQSPTLVRGLLAQGTRVMVVHVDGAARETLDAAFSLISRLSRHWNPVKAVVVGPAADDLEGAARSAGAAAYVAEGSSLEVIEQLTGQLLDGSAPAMGAAAEEPAGGALPRSIPYGVRARRA